MPEPLLRILYVEDSDDIAEITVMTLEMLGGFEVARFVDAETALEAAGDLQPQVMLLDFMLPGMSGMDLFFRLRARPDLDQVPAILLTARAQTHEVEAYRAAGVNDVIVKPYDPAQLCERVRAVWRQSTGS